MQLSDFYFFLFDLLNQLRLNKFGFKQIFNRLNFYIRFFLWLLLIFQSCWFIFRDYHIKSIDFSLIFQLWIIEGNFKCSKPHVWLVFYIVIMSPVLFQKSIMNNLISFFFNLYFLFIVSQAYPEFISPKLDFIIGIFNLFIPNSHHITYMFTREFLCAFLLFFIFKWI